MVKISVVIITFNEEKNIARCLESVMPVADEIVVVDSFSKDRTREICEQYPVRFIEHIFEGHIEQKNFALQKANFDHVLSLDADEALNAEAIDAVLLVKQNWKSDGYRINRLSNYCGKWIRHSGWYPDSKLRLWDRRKGSWGGVNPHDRVVMNENASVTNLKGDLLHYSFTSISQHAQKINYFTDLAAQETLEKQGNLKKYYLKMTFGVAWEFWRRFILKRGFLDGYYGFILPVLSSYYRFLKYIKIVEALKKQAGK
jgi:glycosyltransferase involved in cell wall biosynthesis